MILKEQVKCYMSLCLLFVLGLTLKKKSRMVLGIATERISGSAEQKRDRALWDLGIRPACIRDLRSLATIDDVGR